MRYITKYLQDRRIAVAGMTQTELVDAIYSEMAEFGFLTRYIYADGIVSPPEQTTLSEIKAEKEQAYFLQTKILCT